jgi:hypothetical protein
MELHRSDFEAEGHQDKSESKEHRHQVALRKQRQGQANLPQGRLAGDSENPRDSIDNESRG